MWGKKEWPARVILQVYQKESASDGEKKRMRNRRMTIIHRKEITQGNLSQTSEREVEIEKNRRISKCQWTNGDIYQEEISQGKCNGQGVKKYVSGTVYDGCWRDDLPHDKGIMEFQNGDKYKGQFLEGKYNGEGEYIQMHGGYYKGTWKDGLLMEREGRNYQIEMVSHIKASSTKGNRTEKECLQIFLEKFMKVNSYQGIIMEREFLKMQIELYITDNGRMIFGMERECCIQSMGQCIKVNSSKMQLMVMEFRNAQMEKCMKVFGRMVFHMDQESGDTRMVIYTKENSHIKNVMGREQ